MSHKTPTKKDIAIWKRDAKAHANEKGISHSQALDLLAKDKGFESWRHLCNFRKQSISQDTSNDRIDSLESFLPNQAYKSLTEGTPQVRRSFVTLQSDSVEQAKKELLDQLKSIVRGSKRHVFIEIWCHISEALAENLKGNISAFFDSALSKFSRVTDLQYSVVPNGRSGLPLSLMLKPDGSDLSNFIHGVDLEKDVDTAKGE